MSQEVNKKDVDKMDLVDRLNAKTVQLEALLFVSLNADFETCANRIKSDYLWVCSDLAVSIRSDFDLLANGLGVDDE